MRPMIWTSRPDRQHADAPRDIHVKPVVPCAWLYASLPVLLLALVVIPVSSACAGATPFVLFVEAKLGADLTASVQSVGNASGSEMVTDASEAACGARPAATPRLALMARAPRPTDIEACRELTGSQVIALTIGYQAIALVTPAGAPVFPLRSSQLFRAVTQHIDASGVPSVWRDLDPGLPALQIGLLAPRSGSDADRLFNSYVMEPACVQTEGQRVPFERAGRDQFCGALRTDQRIVRRLGDTSALATWAVSAPAGQIAVVTLAELRQLDQAVVPLPLDDALPTASNIASGKYPAAEKVALLIVIPPDTPATSRDAVRLAAFALLSESGIGPDGSLTHAGLLPLPPADRVAARSNAVEFVEQR